ncbi:metal ABC transporter ATP-binding protein [Rarobacter incanus]|uniref:Manganese/iron transport system ATP-binding protein n=1 Tax=Rarobacter incanus TaxID=153494 RepID=A0A542SQJ1_9MICO|nr:metal ABC transporter ATP-binding protein [Rarobacter incanus]TQK76880.1 manganese/iron transport system ATP-binding protein [Rarobacter incanus]
MTGTDGTAPSLDLADAAFSYGGPPALSGVTAHARAGDAIALIGPNGSGKSTLIKGLLGLVGCVSGTVRVLGESPRDARRRVGLMPQTEELDPEFPVTLRQVVMMGRYRQMGAMRWPSAADKEAVKQAIDRVGLSGHERRRFGELSGGQQQRGILARAIVSGPRILLLDEPFNGLDQTNRDALLKLVSELRAEGVTIVTSTHDLQLARDVCSHVMLLNKSMIAFGPIASTLTLDKIETTFHGLGVEIDEHTLTTPDHDHGRHG